MRDDVARPYYAEDGLTLHMGDVLAVLADLPAESVDCVVTSPPYWSLRKYSGEQGRIWGGEPNCAHEWCLEQRAGEGYAGTARLIGNARTMATVWGGPEPGAPK